MLPRKREYAPPITMQITAMMIQVACQGVLQNAPVSVMEEVRICYVSEPLR